MFNTTYLVEYGPQREKAVLRLGPVNRHLLMGFEGNLMAAEGAVYDLCRQNGLACPKVLALDTSKEKIDRDYMITQYLPSVAMSKAGLGEEKREDLSRKLGIFLAKLHNIHSESFGYVSRTRQGIFFTTWGQALNFEVGDIARRLEQAGGLTTQETKALLEIFAASQPLLDEISKPCLCHTDLWAGNVLLDRESLDIAAVIDSDRAIFADPEFEFASPWMMNQPLLAGYESLRPRSLTPNDHRRRRLYQMYYSLVDAYAGCVEYNDVQLYQEKKKDLMNHMADWGQPG